MAHTITFILLAVGGINWLLVGAFNLDLVSKIFGSGTTITKLVYVLVGLSAIYEVVIHKKYCTICSTTETAPQ